MPALLSATFRHTCLLSSAFSAKHFSLHQPAAQRTSAPSNSCSACVEQTSSPFLLRLSSLRCPDRYSLLLPYFQPPCSAPERSQGLKAIRVGVPLLQRAKADVSPQIPLFNFLTLLSASRFIYSFLVPTHMHISPHAASPSSNLLFRVQ